MAASGTVYAAGAVVWRHLEKRVHVLVIHRTRHDDFSLPKGKVDPGESLPQAAVREIEEETGIRVSLGTPLGGVDYPMPNDRTKEVHYWAAEATDTAVAASTFRPNNEVDGLEWLTIPEARVRFTYASDIDVLELFSQQVERGILRTFALIALRHGKAVQPFDWDGSDATRPLAPHGQRQADAIAPTLAAFGPRVAISSSATRCVDTVRPLVESTGVTLKLAEGISQDAYESDGGAVRETVGKRLHKRKTAVFCSHSPVLPEILHEIAVATATPSAVRLTRAGMLSPAEFTVVHLSADSPVPSIVAVETHSPTT